MKASGTASSRTRRMQDTPELVEIQLELGHHALPKEGGKDEVGYTHDWEVFVRSPEASPKATPHPVHEFVEKVIFYLHDSFPKPKRVFKEPPYLVKESGYAGFELNIEIFFKNKEEPKKIEYKYDLFLHLSDSVHNTRREKLTFQNPNPEFRKKLLRAGGRVIVPDKSALGPALVTTSLKKSPSTNSQPIMPSTSSNSKHESSRSHRVPGKDISSHPSSKERDSSKNKSSSSAKSSLTPSQPIQRPHPVDPPITDLFGLAIHVPSSDNNIAKKEIKKEKKIKPEKMDKSHDQDSKREDKNKRKVKEEVLSPKVIKEKKKNPKKDTPSPGEVSHRRSRSKEPKEKEKDPKKKSSKKSKKKKKKRKARSTSSSSSGTPSDDSSSEEEEERKLKRKKKKESKKEKEKVPSQPTAPSPLPAKKKKRERKSSISSTSSKSKKLAEKSKDKSSDLSYSSRKNLQTENISNHSLRFSNYDKSMVNTLEISVTQTKKTYGQEVKEKNKSELKSLEESEYKSKNKKQEKIRGRDLSVSSPASVISGPDGSASTRVPSQATIRPEEDHTPPSPVSSVGSSSLPSPPKKDSKKRKKNRSRSSDSSHSDVGGGKSSKKDHKKRDEKKRRKGGSSESVSSESGDDETGTSSRASLSTAPDPSASTPVPEDDLLWIQRRICEVEDPDLLEKVVQVIQTSKGQYFVEDEEFKFDLVKFDTRTIYRLKVLLSFPSPG